MVSEQVKKIKKHNKKKFNDRGNWTEWAMVDIEADRKFFDMVDGAAEEIRIQQKNTAEAIATLDFGNIVINDPITGESVNNLKHIVQEMQIDIFSIWTQGENFKADDYLRSVHFDTSLQTFKQGIQSIKEKLSSIDSSEQQTQIELIIANYDSFIAAKQVLDKINSRFLDAEDTSKHLEQLETGLQHLRSRTQQ